MVVKIFRKFYTEIGGKSAENLWNFKINSEKV